MNDLHMQILELIPTKKEKAITSKELMLITGLKFRVLKEIISNLRNIYPICSKETNGGGYWIAENDSDINDFIYMISRRRDGYNKTIKVMQKHKED